MFLEKWGKTLFFSMRFPFFLLLILTPLLFAGVFLVYEKVRLQELEERFAAASRKQWLADLRKKQKTAFLHRYSNADPYFLDKKIESFSFLEKEKEKLEELLKHPAFSGSCAIQNHLIDLQNNTLSFAEEEIHSSTVVCETEEKQKKPVFMNESDLKQILFLIEDVSDKATGEEVLFSISRPQLVIKNFKLQKQKGPFQTEYMQVEMDLLKREFNP